MTFIQHKACINAIFSFKPDFNLFHYSTLLPDFSVQIHSDGYYIVNVGGEPWLNRASTFFIADGKPFSTFDDTLALTQTTRGTGQDKLGKWNSTNFHYRAGSAEIIASVHQYVDPPRPMAVFSQVTSGIKKIKEWKS